MEERKPNSLFELVQSLTAGEKRSFKLLANYTKTHDKQYLNLFNILDQMTKYDEAKLKIKLKHANVKTPLPVLNNYLQELILTTLRFYHSGKSVDSKIMELITDAGILHNKGLSKFRDKALRKAKRLSIECEKTTLLLEIINKEWHYQSVFVAKEVSEFKGILNDLNKQQQYRELNFMQSNLLSKGEIRDDELKNEWELLIKSPLLNKDTERKRYEEIYHYHHIMMRYKFRMNNFAKCVYHQTQLIEQMELRMDLLLDYKELYMFELNGLVVAHCQNKDLESASIANSKLMQMLKWELNPKERTSLIDIISIAYSNLIHGYFITSAFDKALVFAGQAELFLKTYDVSLYQKAFLYLNLAKANIYKGDYHAAVLWNNKILNAPIDKKREDFSVLSWIFNLIIQFELKHFELLQSLTRSTAIFLEKRRQLHITESVILNYLKNKFPKSKSRKETIALFIEMKSEMEAIKKDPYEAKAFEYFDYVSWLKSKIENKTLIEINS